ncbi:MAG TPA: phosphocholine cytidylyltransferase family protein [Thermoanaerobaculia bacterium]
MTAPMRAVILAAGSARRMRPLTDELPKCLLSVAGRTILSRAVSILAGCGIKRITVVDGFAGDRVRSALGSEFPPSWFTFVRNPDFETTNNAYSLWLARRPEDESLLLLDADVVFDAGVAGRLIGDEHANRLAVRCRGEIGDEDVKVQLGGDGRITDIGKHVSLDRAAGESVGLAAFSAPFGRRLFEVLERRLLREGRLNEWYESAFLELIVAGEAVYAVDVEDLRAMEVDTPEDLRRARNLFEAPAR